MNNFLALPCVLAGLVCVLAPRFDPPGAPTGTPQVTASPSRAPASAALLGLVPSEHGVVLEGPALSQILRQGQSHGLVRALESSPLMPLIAKRQGASIAELLEYADAYWGSNALHALSELCDLGFVLSIGPGAKEKNQTLLLLRGSNADSVESAVQRVFELGTQHAGWPKLLQRMARQRGDAQLWSFDEFAFARQAGLLVASNNPALVERILDAAQLQDTPPAGDAQAPDSTFALRYAADQESALRLWIDMERVHTLSEGVDQWAQLRHMGREPGVQFLLGPMLGLIGSGRVLTLDFVLQGSRFDLRATALGLPEGPQTLLLPAAESSSKPALAASNLDLAGGVVYRDFSKLVDNRSELFSAEHLPEFANAISTSALFFAGDDVSRSLLPYVSPHVTLVVREQQFRAGATPSLPLPAAAAIFQLDPEKAELLGGQLQSAFQSLVGIAGVERAQQGHDMLMLELALVGNVQMTTARFPLPADPGAVDLRYNLEPACARVGRNFVLGTHRSLVEALALELAKDAGAPVAAGSAQRSSNDEQLQVRTHLLAKAFERARGPLVMQAVLEQGKSEEQARADFELGVELLRFLSTVEWSSRRPNSDGLELTLSLAWPRAGVGKDGMR